MILKYKCVYITNNLLRASSGGKRVATSNLDILKSICREVVVINITRDNGEKQPNNDFYVSQTANKYFTLLNNIVGFSSGLNLKSVRAIKDIIKSESPDIVWIDGSQFGRISKSIKEISKDIRVITMFHNVEKDFKRSLAKRKNPLYYISMFSDQYNESLCCKYSDYIISLTTTDSDRIKKIYKRSADLIVPVTINNLVEKSSFPDPISATKYGNYCLFVGSRFPPNEEAVDFLNREVANRVNCKILVVGSGFEEVKQKYNNLEVIGFVEDISSFYKNSICVLSPIFSGAGMKVKIAEALMYGKVIIASPFSLIGYDEIDKIPSVKVAHNGKEFISIINNFHDNPMYYSSDSYKYFLNYNSMKAQTVRISNLISGKSE